MNKELKGEWNEFFNFATIVFGLLTIIGVVIFVIGELILGGYWYLVAPFLFCVCFLSKILTN